MPHSRLTSDEIVRRGQLLYEQQIRAAVEADNRGKYLVLNVETGEYEMDNSELAAWRRAEAKAPDGAFFLLRVGFPAAYRLGRSIKVRV